jgi:predicted transcriptional regulator
MGVRELARHLQRDVKRVHEDAQALVELGLIERDTKGSLTCPYADIHVDMHIAPNLQAA